MQDKSSRPSLRDHAYLRLYHRLNRARFAALRLWLAPRVRFGKQVDIWASCLRYQGLGSAVFHDCSIIERGPHKLLLDIEAGGHIDIRERVYFRTKYAANVLTAFEHGRISIGEDCLLNGCIISARERVDIGKGCMLSWNVSVLDCNLHQISNSEPEKIAAVSIGDYTWLGNCVTVLPGVKIGSHCVIAAGSIVTSDIPDNSLAAGVPAKIIRSIDDRDRAR